MRTVCVIPLALMMEPKKYLMVYTLCWRRVDGGRCYFNRAVDVRHEAEEMAIPLEGLRDFMSVQTFIGLLKGSLFI